MENEAPPTTDDAPASASLNQLRVEVYRAALNTVLRGLDTEDLLVVQRGVFALEAISDRRPIAVTLA